VTGGDAVDSVRAMRNLVITCVRIVIAMSMPMAIALAAHQPVTTEILFVSSAELGVVTSIDLQTFRITHLPLQVPSADSLACGSDGRLFLGQSGGLGGGRVIVSFNVDGTGLRTEVDFRSDSRLGGGPLGLTFATNGELFFNTAASVAPQTGVWRVAERGNTPTRVIPPPNVGGGGPIAFLTHGKYSSHLIVGQSGPGRILRRAPPFDADAHATEFVSGLPPRLFGLAINSRGEIFVSDGTTGVITRCALEGTQCNLFAATLFQLRGIAFDRGDTLYGATFEGPLLRVRPNGLPEPIPGILIRGGTAVAICEVGATKRPPF
jgi:hypothetical protein